jgi:putative ABC transport system permease protein
MPTLLRRLAYLFRLRQIETDLAEEMETHRAMQQSRLEASGVPARDAVHASRRALGNTTLALEDARSIWIWPWLGSVRQDVAYALRALRRNPGFSAAVILVTSFGIGATTSVFALVDGLVLKPLPVHNPDRLVYVAKPSFSYPVYSEVRQRGTDIFSAFFAWNIESANIDWTGELEPTEILMASGDFYATLGIQPAIGRTFSAEDDRPGGGPNGMVAVLSYASWQGRFGSDPSVIGRTVRIERQPFTIVGVAPRGFFGVVAGLAPEITIPLTTIQDARALTSTTSSWLHLMGRLQDGLDREQANVAFQRIWPAVLEVTTSPGMPADRRARYLGTQATLESGATGFSRVRTQFAEALWMLFALVGLLFVVACASAANLLLARGVARQREIAVRLAIGASRPRLIRQLFTESLVSAALAAGFAVLFAAWAGGWLIAMMAWREQPIVMDVSPNWRVLLFAFGLTVLTVILCSVLPALRVTHVGAGTTLKETGQTAGAVLRRWSLGKVLVVSQVAVTMVLLVGAGLFVRSLTTVLAQDAGFDREKVVVVATDAEVGGYEGERLSAYYAQLRERLAAIPGVESVSLSMKPPISNEEGSRTESITVDNEPMEADASRSAYFNEVSAEYFDTLGMRLLQGRGFSTADTPASTPVVVVNESLARRFFRNENPIGRHISVGRNERRRSLEIVGLVQDTKYQTLQEPDRLIAFLPLGQVGIDENVFVEVRPIGRPSAIVEQVRREVRALDGTMPIRIETVTDRIRESLVKERVMAFLASGLGFTALVLACAGLYGLLAYAVSRQSKEIGLRLALGATRATVLWAVLRDCLIVAALGIAVGGGASLALGRYVRTLLFQVSAADPVSLVGAGTLMLVVATLAGFVPARRAAAVDPAGALRE